jgi:hypothetical protein
VSTEQLEKPRFVKYLTSVNQQSSLQVHGADLVNREQGCAVNVLFCILNEHVVVVDQQC